MFFWESLRQLLIGPVLMAEGPKEPPEAPAPPARTVRQRTTTRPETPASRRSEQAPPIDPTGEVESPPKESP